MSAEAEPAGIHSTLPDLAWEDAALPARFWSMTERLPSGCWVPKDRRQPVNFRETVVARLLRVRWRDVFACTPTCGNVACCRPCHSCVVLRTVASSHAKERF